MYYVYILRGNDKHYVGYSSNVIRRFEEHKSGKTKTTRKMDNLVLEGYFEKSTKTEAIKLERMIKKNGHINHWLNHETFIKFNKDDLVAVSHATLRDSSAGSVI